MKDVKKWDREKKESSEEKEERKVEEVDDFFLHGNRFSSSTQALQDYLQVGGTIQNSKASSCEG